MRMDGKVNLSCARKNYIMLIGIGERNKKKSQGGAMSNLTIVSFENFAKRIRDLPSDYAAHLTRLQDEPNGTRVYSAPSFSKADLSYTVKIKLEEGQVWKATCRCRGYRQHQEPTNPCRHVVACILVDERFNPESFPELEADLDEIKAMQRQQLEPIEEREQQSATMEELHKVFWPSGAGLLEICPAAQQTGDDPIILKQTGVAADVGSAIHSVLARAIERERPYIEDDVVKSTAIQFSVQGHEDTIKSLAIAGVMLWNGEGQEKGLRSLFEGSPIIEEKMTFTSSRQHPVTHQPVTIEFRGRADALGFRFNGQKDPQEAVVIDWKSGRKTDDGPRDAFDRSAIAEDETVTLRDVGHLTQMRATAMLAASMHKSIKRVTVVLVWLRDRQCSIYQFSRDELDDWLRRFISYTAFWDGKTYTKGNHCEYCPRVLSCPAYARMIKNALVAVTDGTIEERLFQNGELVDADLAAKYLIALRQAKKQIQQAEEAMRTQFSKISPVPVPSKEGYVIGIQKVNSGFVVDPQKAWPILKEVYTAEERAAFTSIRTTGMKEVLFEKTEKGQKGKAYDSLVQQLKESGATTTKAPREVFTIFKEESNES